MSSGLAVSARSSSRSETQYHHVLRSTWQSRFVRRSASADPRTLIGLTNRRPKQSSSSQPDERPVRTIKVGGVSLPYPEPASPGVSAQMRGNRRMDTNPERLVRSLLHRQGFRFRKDAVVIVDGVRVTADIVFPSKRVAVFIDGCFWHGCPDHGRPPHVNKLYWNAKLARNVERDARNTRRRSPVNRASCQPGEAPPDDHLETVETVGRAGLVTYNETLPRPAAWRPR
jgi:DNA mismatch endonuclease (patch repair protein)